MSLLKLIMISIFVKTSTETPIKGIKKYFVTKVTIMRDPEGNRQRLFISLRRYHRKESTRAGNY